MTFIDRLPRLFRADPPASEASDANVALARWLNWGAALLVVLIMTATAAILVTMRGRALSEASRELKSLSLVLADQLDRNFQSIELVEQALVADFGLGRSSTPEEFRSQFSGEAAHRMLAQRIAAYPHISGLSLRDADGEIVNSSIRWPNDRGLLSPNPAESLRSGSEQIIVGPPSRSPVSGKWNIYIARRISSPSGQFLGMVLGTIKLQNFEDYFAKVLPTEGSSIALFRNDGTLVARHPSLSGIVGKIFPEQALGGGSPEAEFSQFRLQSPIDGKERLVAARRLAHYPLSLRMTTTVEEALSDWYSSATYLVSTSTAIIVAIVVIIVLCRRQFLGRMRTQNIQLAAALNNIAQGLIMLDARARLVICNRRYAEMYRLPAEMSRPGTPLSAILEWRKFDGTFFGEPQDEVTRLIERSGIQIESKDMQTEDGRAISIVSASMEDGGWVATHEDITERVKKEASFRLLFESNPVPMWVYDQGTLGFIAVNQAAIARYGYSKERFVSLTVADIRPPEARERFLTWLTDPAPNDPDNDTWQHVTAAGEVMDVSIYSQALEYEGRNARLVAIHDVTEQRRATAELAKTKMFLDAVIENVPVPIVVKDVPAGATSADNCRLSLLNRAAEDLYGRTRSACIGRTLAEIFPEASGQAAIRLDADALAFDGAIVSEDHMTFSPSKGLRLVTSKRLALRSTLGEPEHLLALFEDVTDRRENEKRIAYMAHHDILTGLANRAAFDQCFAATLEQAQGKGSQVSLMCIDLDGFKEINDTYGHSAGDAVLREVAKRLNLGGEGAFIARFGGDEFALIVADDRKGTSSEFVAGQILNMMRAEIRVGEHRLKVGATIGIAQYPVHGTDCESLLCNADIALYRAKAAEPGTVQFFTPQMGAQVRDRRNLQDDLGRAIAAGEISLHYQPQCLSDGSVIGFEALARWNSPKRGMVSPAQFIEIAEESGLIQPLGEWVLREACREAAGWPQPFKISVNVSPKQFRDGDLPNLVQWILLETGLTPGRLELEITEGVLIGDFSRAVSVLNRLKALGVDIALDDFGTGYSSLSYLHSFPFDLIKIDRTFVSDVRTNRHSSAIVRAVIGLGRSLGVPILAEGVETEEQRAFLFEEGCHAVQGYLTGRPAPAEAYPQLLRVGGESPGRARLRVGRT